MDIKDLYDMYDEMIDEVTPGIQIGNITFDPSKVLKELDPIAYECGFNDWLDSQEIDLDD